MAGVPLTNVGDVQPGELCQQLQVLECALVENVIAVDDQQAGQAGAYCSKNFPQGIAFAREAVR